MNPDIPNVDDMMYEVLRDANFHIGDVDSGTRERVVLSRSIDNFKSKIVDFINHTSGSNDEYLVGDIFVNVSDSNGRLHYLGYKFLKNHYRFIEVEFNFIPTMYNYSAISKAFKGLYFLSSFNEKTKTIKILTTNTRMATWLQMVKDDFESFIGFLKANDIIK